MIGTKAQWVVKAGLIPGEPEMDEYTKAWSYTSIDYEEDGNQRGERFKAAQEAVHRHAFKLEKGGLNWVVTEYVWV